MMLTVSQGDWNANLKKIADLTRENAQQRAVIAEQNETIEAYTTKHNNDESFIQKLFFQYAEQSALIEKLGEALTALVCYSRERCCGLLIADEALAELAAWRDKK